MTQDKAGHHENLDLNAHQCGFSLQKLQGFSFDLGPVSSWVFVIWFSDDSVSYCHGYTVRIFMGKIVSFGLFLSHGVALSA